MTNSNKKWLLYGANGYTGRLVAELARERGLSPVLAGRNEEQVTALANELGFESRVFSLSDAEACDRALHDISAVLHCAGPFVHTSKPMLDACIRNKVHYLDVTGECSVFEAIAARHLECEKAGVVALPGVGFDVVPSDCLAALLKQRLPTATHITLAFAAFGKTSPGTAKTMAGQLHSSLVREHGKLVEIPVGSRVRQIAFNDKLNLSCVSIPWGDVSTAFYSTDVGNIEVYMSMPTANIKALKRLALVAPLFRLTFVKKIMQRFAGNVVGPTRDERARSKVFLYGEAKDASGKKIEIRMQTPDGYDLTQDAAIKAVEKVLSGSVAPGFRTPSMAFGVSFLAELHGVQFIEP